MKIFYRIMYQIRNESFANPDENTKISEKYLVTIKNSSYLKMVKNITFYNDIFDDKYIHYGIFSWNHLVDIISAEKPNIRKLENHTEE